MSMLRALSQPGNAGEVAGVETDSTLVAAAREDPAAFELLHQRYAARVYRYLLLRSASPEDAADLTQAVFLKAWNGLAAYRQRSNPFAAYLFTIARNAAIDAHRARRSNTPIDLVPDLPADGANPEAHAIERERLAHLRGVIATLDPEKRELLALRFAAGLSSREIAALVGKSESATKKQLTRIIATLKEHYRDELT